MTRTSRSRPRGVAMAARAVSACALPLAAVALLTLAACEGPNTPDSVLTTHSETNIAVLGLWKYLFFFGTLVFIVVEALLIYVIFKFRRKPGESIEPRHVHGNTTLEVLWTAIPAVILVFIAVPTVRTIFRTQAKAKAGALQVEVIGHQWWWEFRYPEYNVTTSNELYLPTGRTVNFALKTADVLHSFWIPARGLKTYSSNACIGCHYINGNPISMGKLGPNLTHVGSRNTIAGGLFPNDTRHLSAWIKNARAMKPGVTMPTLGLNEYDPTTKAKVTAGGLTDQQIADIVAYLHALK